MSEQILNVSLYLDSLSMNKDESRQESVVRTQKEDSHTRKPNNGAIMTTAVAIGWSDDGCPNEGEVLQEGQLRGRQENRQRESSVDTRGWDGKPDS